MVALKAEKGFMMTFHFAASHDLVVGGMLKKSQPKLFFDLRYSKECVCIYMYEFKDSFDNAQHASTQNLALWGEQ